MEWEDTFRLSRDHRQLTSRRCSFSQLSGLQWVVVLDASINLRSPRDRYLTRLRRSLSAERRVKQGRERKVFCA
ncbi:hypothetical protein AHF37_03332 [Paragonimus kellicotti]|nr:hypothetical protein AHF37_03332 [Paragonimus kellicotti]